MSLTSSVGSFEHPLSSDKVQQMLSIIDDGFFILDNSLRVVYFNQMTRHHLWNFYDFNCEVGDKVIPLLPEDRRGPIESFFKRVLQGESIRYTHEIPKKEGHTLWVDCHYFPLRNKHGEITGIGGSLKDITAKYLYRLQLEEKSQEMTDILESIGDGFFTMDKNYIIRYANSQAAKLVGLTPEFSIGKSLKDLFPNPSTKRFFNGYQKAFETGQPVRVEGYYAPLDKWLDISIYPSNDMLTVYGRDITQKRKLEEKLLELKLAEQKMVIQATIEGQEKERELLSNELHDNVSQVLTTTKLYLELATSEKNQSPSALLQKSIENLTAAINDLRLISYALLPSTLNDMGIIDSIHELIEPYRHAKKFEVSFAHSGDMQKLSGAFKVNLFRIIQERLHNIAICSRASSVKIWLSCSDEVEVSLQDDGKGLSAVSEIHLATIRNRTELFDGIATINQSPYKGTLIHLIFPFASCT
ncbi:MAG: PAS domain-containing sensor histidine kinase [Flavisolibacter sp.]